MTATKTAAQQSTSNLDTAASIWDGVHKNRRYLSDWDNNTVLIDSRADGKTTDEPLIFLLSEITISATGELSIYSAAHLPLTNFPDFIATLKFSINSALRGKKANHRALVTQVLNHGIRFFSFCVGRGVYRLSDVSRDLVEEYRKKVLELGWWHANDYDLQLKRLLTKLESGEIPHESLRRKTLNNTNFSLNVEELQRKTGLRIPTQMVPQWFYEEYRKIAKEAKLPLSTSDNTPEPTEKSCKLVFDSINLFCFSRDGFDAIPFVAFPNAAKMCRVYFKASQRDKRTKTLTLPVAVSIIQQALAWLYDYGPTLLEILNDIRSELEEADKNSHLHIRRRQRLALRIFSTALQKFQSKHHLPLPELDDPKRQPEKLRMLTLIYQTALFFIIAGTTARRRNEITGEERTYGLYFGSLRKVQDDCEDHKADFYIEKTLQGYKEFWVPKTCVDSIRALEELSQVFRPLGSSRKIPDENLVRAREDKLFALRNFKSYSPHIMEPASFEISFHCGDFFRLCGIEQNLIFNKNRSIFRRFYCNLFVNRYDNPVAAALQHHLDHSHMGATAIYGLDPHDRDAEEKSAAIFRKEEDDDESFLSINSEVRQEHHVAKVIELLSGKSVGGIYSRLILKLTARLSRDSSFSLAPVETKGKIVADKMNSRGFAALENGHGMCMAGTARHTAKKANCAHDGEPHPEVASPTVCGGCINLMNPEGYQHHLEQERDALLLEAADMTLPRAVREAKRKDAADVDAYLAADRRIAEGNKQIILKLVESWSEMEKLSEK
ncbi:hypothetical protein [Burkholderia multivorans]|uniref:hypothetical protein n=1 Tax=Burkholderia multivorans TaxID=87883 RepID=UPI0011B28D72|nr:hypothetical protein [Burkholderia multivorans]